VNNRNVTTLKLPIHSSGNTTFIRNVRAEEIWRRI
jgi:hypothetical protein